MRPSAVTAADTARALRNCCEAKNFSGNGPTCPSGSPCSSIADVKAIAPNGRTYWLCWLHHAAWQGGTSLANVLAGTRDRFNRGGG